MDPMAEPAPAAEASASASANMSAVPAEARSASRGFIAAWNAEDPNAVAAFFTEGATGKMPDGTMLNGRSEMLTKWIRPQLPRTATLTTSGETAMMMNGGNTIHATGNYSEATTDGKTETGRYMIMWARQADGSWKISSMELTD